MILEKAIITEITRALLEQIINDVVLFSKIDELRLPSQVRYFFAHAIVCKIEKSLTTLEIPFTNKDDYRLRKLIKDFSRQIISLISIQKNQITEVLEDTVKQTLMYLLDPADVLGSILFEKHDKRKGSDLVSQLNLFREYEYLTGIILKFLTRSSSQIFTKQILIHTVRLIDIKVFEKRSLEQKLIAIKPLFSFLALTGEDKVSLDIIKFFYTTRRSIEIVNKIDLFLFEHKNKFVSFEDFIKIVQNEHTAIVLEDTGELESGVEDVYVSEEKLTHLSADDQPKKEDSDKNSRGIELLHGDRSSFIYREDKNDISFENDISTRADATSTHPVTESNTNHTKRILVKPKPKYIFKTRRDEDEVQHDDINNVLEHHEVSTSDVTAHDQKVGEPISVERVNKVKRIADLDAYFDPKEKKRIIKKVFKKNEDLYLQSIRDLNNIETWQEGVKYIENEIFAKFKVDIFSDEALLFTDKAHAMYIQTERE